MGADLWLNPGLTRSEDKAISDERDRAAYERGLAQGRYEGAQDGLRIAKDALAVQTPTIFIPAVCPHCGASLGEKP